MALKLQQEGIDSCIELLKAAQKEIEEAEKSITIPKNYKGKEKINALLQELNMSSQEINKIVTGIQEAVRNINNAESMNTRAILSGALAGMLTSMNLGNDDVIMDRAKYFDLNNKKYGLTGMHQEPNGKFDEVVTVGTKENLVKAGFISGNNHNKVVVYFNGQNGVLGSVSKNSHPFNKQEENFECDVIVLEFKSVDYYKNNDCIENTLKTIKKYADNDAEIVVLGYSLGGHGALRLTEELIKNNTYQGSITLHTLDGLKAGMAKNGMDRYLNVLADDRVSMIHEVSSDKTAQRDYKPIASKLSKHEGSIFVEEKEYSHKTIALNRAPEIANKKEEEEPKVTKNNEQSNNSNVNVKEECKLNGKHVKSNNNFDDVVTQGSGNNTVKAGLIQGEKHDEVIVYIADNSKIKTAVSKNNHPFNENETYEKDIVVLEYQDKESYKNKKVIDNTAKILQQYIDSGADIEILGQTSGYNAAVTIMKKLAHEEGYKGHITLHTLDKK